MNETRKITQMGLLLAIAIVLKGLAVYIPVMGALGIRIGFMAVVVVATGVFYGPVSGVIFGAVYDLLAFMVFPTGGPYFPGFTISFAMVGFWGGIFLHGRMKNKKQIGYGHCIFLFSIIALSVDLLLNTLWLSMLTGKAFSVLLVPRIAAKMIMLPINAYVLLLFIKLFGRMKMA